MPGDVFGPTYRIRQELGSGGMATVYLADDAKHGRQVALKVLHPEFAASLGPKRFRREITLAARLQHPHIVSVYDSGETATGLLWFTMPYVVGESLRDRLSRDGQLSLEDTVRITTEIADALQYAHDHGVLHRDVKPENILLSGGHALLADFGIARTLAGDDALSSATPAATLTQSGFAVGTPTYMSPEQASGEHAIDARSDQYGLGVLAYEMLAGERPFTAPTPQAAIAKMLASPPPSIRVVRRDVPVGVNAALRRALGTAPASRFPTVTAFGAALSAGQRTGTVDPHARRTQWLVTTVASILALAAGVATATYLRAAHRNEPVMLAVLPFQTEGDTTNAWITDDITDEVRGKLAALSHVRVIASASSNQYRGTPKSPQQIGRELGVRYLLMGRIRWAGAAGRSREIRVEPELVQVADVRTPETRWSQPIVEDGSDLFKVQSDIAGRVASALALTIDPTERSVISRPPTQDSSAYYAYLQGELLVRNLDPNARFRAIAEFRRAVQIDSTFALAWYELAGEMLNYAGRHPTSPAFDDSAREAAEHAASFEAQLPGARYALALYDELMKHDFRRAFVDYRTALNHAPNQYTILTGLARTEMRLGMWDSAVVHSQLAVQLNPQNSFANAALGNVEILVRHYDDAARACTKATALNPSNILAVFCAIQVPIAHGDLPVARAMIRAASPPIDSTFLYVFLGSYGAYTWVLDSTQRRALLAVPVSKYDRSRSTWATVQALLYYQFGDSAKMKAYADSALLALKSEDGPAAADSDANDAWALSMAGRRAEAIAAADRYLSVHPIDGDFLDGPDNAETVLKAYVRAGATDKALNLLDQLLRIPDRLTPARVRADPFFRPLRDNPRFQQLVSTPAFGEQRP